MQNMSDPNWSQVLDALYRHGSPIQKPNGRITQYNMLCERSGLNPEEVAEALDNLQRNGLVSVKETDYAEKVLGNPKNPRTEKVELKQRGFEVAHDRELSKRQEGASTATAYLTGILAVTAVVQATAAASTASSEDKLLLYLMVAGTGIILVVSWWQLYQIGLIDVERFD